MAPPTHLLLLPSSCSADFQPLRGSRKAFPLALVLSPTRELSTQVHAVVAMPLAVTTSVAVGSAVPSQPLVLR